VTTGGQNNRKGEQKERMKKGKVRNGRPGWINDVVKKLWGKKIKLVKRVGDVQIHRRVATGKLGKGSLEVIVLT
jgi:hypothetical protein